MHITQNRHVDLSAFLALESGFFVINALTGSQTGPVQLALPSNISEYHSGGGVHLVLRLRVETGTSRNCMGVKQYTATMVSFLRTSALAPCQGPQNDPNY